MPAPRIARNVVKAARQPREGDSVAHLRWLKTLNCVVCGKPADDPHHLLRGVDNRPKGMGRKNPDRWAIPSCRACHDDMHAAGDDEAFLAAQGIDGRSIAFALWACTGNTEIAERTILRAWQAARLNKRAAE